MWLSRALATQVSPTIRARGASYAASGAVARLDTEFGIAHAVVVGTDRYDVWIEPHGKALRVGCRCPYFLDNIDVCKHVWATVLEAEEWLESQYPTREIPEFHPIDIDDPYELDDPEGNFDTIPPPALTTRPREPKPAPWTFLLGLVTSADETPTPATPVPSRVPLFYALDIPTSAVSDDLVLEVLARQRKADGAWAAPKAIRLTTHDVRTWPDTPDRDILERLAGASSDDPRFGNFAPYTSLSRVRLGRSLSGDLLQRLCGTGRLAARVETLESHGRTGATTSTLLPLAWDDGPPFRLTLRIERSVDPSGYTIVGAFERDEDRLALDDPLLVLTAGLLTTRTHVARVDIRGLGWRDALAVRNPLFVPDVGRTALLDALLAQPAHVETRPPDLDLRIEDWAPVPWLQLRADRYDTRRLEGEVTFAYADLRVPASQPQPVLRSAEGTVAIRRDLDAERRLLDTLPALGFRQGWGTARGGPTPTLPTTHLPRVTRALLADGWRVEARGVRYQQPGVVAMHVSSGTDWFDLHGGVDYGDQHASLPALLQAVSRGDEFVTLDDGSFGLLPEEWLAKHRLLASLGTPQGDHLRFRSSQTALLDALLAAQPEASCDEAFSRARARLAGFNGIEPVDPPASFTGTLRNYQREGLGWLLFLQHFGFGGCLADDMGLGKTVMVLALLARQYGTTRRSTRAAAPPTLIVAPRSLIFNWQREAARFTPHLRVLDYTGTGRVDHREAFAEYQIVLTTYGTLRRDAAHLAEQPFEYVVLDEAQAVKNASSASAKAARLLSGRHRLALSGTPVENHIGELWSLFEFLNPGVLGTASAFEQAHSGRTLDEGAVGTLARGLRPFVLRRTKEQVAPELPRKTEQTLYCELPRKQRALYDELRNHYRSRLLANGNGASLGRAKLQVLEALLRLRQAACHPGLLDPKRTGEDSAKLDALIPQVTEAVAEGHKTLVFSQFTSLLAIVRHRLDADGITYEYLDGRTRDREAKVRRFQEDADCRLFLISLKAGGLGLNLTAAEYVFLLDPWWNPAVEAQAIDRAHRIGQTQHVFAYRLIAKDTIEERVLELQQQKRSLADAILSADGSLIRTLKREDLEMLLS